MSALNTLISIDYLGAKRAAGILGVDDGTAARLMGRNQIHSFKLEPNLRQPL